MTRRPVSASSAAVSIPVGPAPTTTSPITYSYTLEAGDDAWAEVAPYVLADEVSLKFVGGEAMTMKGKLSARYGTATNAVGSFSNVGTLPLVEEILSGLGTFYLTPSGSGWGTGQVTAGNILAGDIQIKTTWTRKFPVDSGNLYSSTAVFAGIEITGELTLEAMVSGTYGAFGSAGQKDKWRSEVPQLLRAQWPGGAITAGTTYLTKLLQIDLPIKWDTFEPLGEQKGNDIVVGKFFSYYNEQTPTAGRGTFTIVRNGTSEFAGA